MTGALWLAGYVLTIPLANWFIGNVGWCPDGAPPCLLPVWWGLWAPSGVIWAGLAFSLRDAVQERLGKRWAVVAIVVGSALSLAVSDPFIALASASAFLFSELADFAIYSRLRARGLVTAVVASNAIGTVADSLIFLIVAGFPLALLPGLVVGKAWTILLAVILIRLRQGQRRPFVGAVA